MKTNPTEYAHPEVLIEADWLEQHLDDKDIRVVESNEDILLYDTGHIPGAAHIDWRTDLQDQVIRDYIVPEKCTECVGHFDQEQCAAVCPVDCCVPDPNHVETEEQLFERATILHPDREFQPLTEATSHFKKNA